MRQTLLTVAGNGRVVIPVEMRAALGVPQGGKLIARLADGALTLEPIELCVRRAQALVGKYVPRNAGLADELISARHDSALEE